MHARNMDGISGPFDAETTQSKSKFPCHRAVRTFISTHHRSTPGTPDRIASRANARIGRADCATSTSERANAKPCQSHGGTHTHTRSRRPLQSSFFCMASAYSTTTSQFLSFAAHAHSRSTYVPSTLSSCRSHSLVCLWLANTLVLG